MKANDKIPADEMLLAEAIAAARARGLAWAQAATFERNGRYCEPAEATHCCALGALHFAGRVNMKGRNYFSSGPFADVIYGNDVDDKWERESHDFGESLGWAYRCAMEDV